MIKTTPPYQNPHTILPDEPIGLVGAVSYCNFSQRNALRKKQLVPIEGSVSPSRVGDGSFYIGVGIILRHPVKRLLACNNSLILHKNRDVEHVLSELAVLQRIMRNETHNEVGIGGRGDSRVF